LSEDIHDILGFMHYNPINFSYPMSIKSDRPAQLNAGLNAIYVYCDIIEPQYIGDTRARLLRTVEIPDEAKFGSTIDIKYDSPHYVPIIINDFDHIEIDLKDDTGDTIPFLYGRSRVKLHIRKRND
jgi:hypothetical protein